MTEISKRYTVANFADKYPEFTTESSLRWLIFNADNNGMNDFGVIERISRRVLINCNNFFTWLEAINNSTPSSKTGGRK
jgi:hypothetical protein